MPSPRPLLRRGPCPCAGPLRGAPPAAASRARSVARLPRAFPALAGPAPRRCPPGSRARALVRPCGPPRPLAGPAVLRPCPRCAAGSLFGRPCSGSCSARALRGFPAGSPPRRPLRGFGGGLLRPRGPLRPFGPLVWGPLAPGAFWAARPARAGLAALLRGCCGGCGLRPGLPPRPCRPLRGLAGCAWLFEGFAPAAWAALFAPLLRAPRRAAPAPGAAAAARLTVWKLSTDLYTHRVGGLNSSAAFAVVTSFRIWPGSLATLARPSFTPSRVNCTFGP